MSAFLFVFLFLTVGNAQPIETDVIIMGAGMAGVSAGKILAEAGVNFRIVEAQNYIGGRTRSIQFGSPIVGVYGVNQCASWISGACAPGTPGAPQSCAYRVPESPPPGCSAPNVVNPMLNLSEHADPPIEYAQTPFHDWDIDGSNYPAYLRGGEHVPRGEVTSEYQQWWYVQRCMTERYNCMWQTGNPCDDMSYGETLDYCGWTAETDIKQAIQWTEFDLHMATNIYEYSMKMGGGPGTYCEYGNQDLYIKDDRGYQGVTLGVAEGILSSITLNAPVAIVAYDSAGVYVVTGDGTEYHAQYGLVTFSNGVLQRALETQNIDFIPPLPQWKQNAIQQLNMVNYSAVYVQWPYKFWNQEPYYEHEEIDDNVVVVLLDDRYGWFPWFINMNHENYRPGSLIWRFDVVADVAYQIQLQSIEQTTQDLITKISAYFPLSGVPIPLTVSVGTSTVNPYIAGAYAGYPIGYDWYGNQGDLGHSVGEGTQPRLYFAGEGTSTKTSGYVLTAYEEGIRAAQEIKVCLGYNVPSVWCQGPYTQRNNTSKHPPRKPRGRRH